MSAPRSPNKSIRNYIGDKNYRCCTLEHDLCFFKLFFRVIERVGDYTLSFQMEMLIDLCAVDNLSTRN